VYGCYEGHEHPQIDLENDFCEKKRKKHKKTFVSKHSIAFTFDGSWDNAKDLKVPGLRSNWKLSKGLICILFKIPTYTQPD